MLKCVKYLFYKKVKAVSDKIKSQVSQDNKNEIPIETDYVTIILNKTKTKPNVNIRNTYIKDIIAYHKLLVHRGAFESMITKVLENKDEIYTVEFQNHFNNERDKFLELLRKKSGAFTSKL